MLCSDFTIHSEDGLELPLRRFSPPGRRPSGAVLMLHGASASSETFLTPRGGIALYLLQRGVEVWVLDWRGSNRVLDKPEAESAGLFTFDQVAEYDLPAALQHVRRTSACDHLSVFAHCIGASCVSMALSRGLLARFAIEELVLSTIGLFFSAPIESFLKAEDGIPERISAQDPAYTVIDPNAGAS